ncbi:IKI3 family-domain-containing protein [Lipomyces oligophaga]|uniref:IKI3 family-domain-containing protein n=1 Tax=Lipomyces oligophaga TaxID=45792 RepID=UPI0034CF556E
MWNLLPIQRARVPAPSSAAPDLAPRAAFLDPVTSLLFIALGPSIEPPYTFELVCISPSAASSERPTTIAVWDVARSGDSVVDLRFFADEQTVVLVTKLGDIFRVCLAPGPVTEFPIVSSDSVFASNLSPELVSPEIVGSIDPGIAAAQWSPEEEILALATNTPSLILLNRELDFITEVPLQISDLDLSRHVSVGWGRKETQFEGKGAKAMRDPTMPDKVDSGSLCEWDDRTVRVSWRGDGQYLAISSVDEYAPDSSRRTIRVHARDGSLVSVSQPVDGQDSFLSWRPSGNLLASVQRNESDNNLDVIFFERNGLRRGEFSTSLSYSQLVLDLQWNAQSSVLALLITDKLQLWTTNNYHWYLKQEISCPGVSFLSWHTEKPLSLLLGFEDCVEILDFVFDIARGPRDPPMDKGVVLVIDGPQLKLTPLALANTPPPMSFRTLVLSSPALHAAINGVNDCIAVLENDRIELAPWSLVSSPSSIAAPKVAQTVMLNAFEQSGVARQIKFADQTTLAVLFDIGNRSKVVLFRVSSETDLSPHILFSEEFTLPVLSICPRSDHRSLCVQLADGTVRQILISAESGSISSAALVKFPERCSLFSVVVLHSSADYYVDSDNSLETRIIPIGLASNGHLYIGSQRLHNSCTSFFCTQSHLAFTTSNNYLKFVHLSNSLELPDIPSDPPAGATSSTDERCRAIERGAKIVSIIPSRVSVILQMPRGNLETIFPRLLVLQGVRNAIERIDYADAFKACRAHRVNLDILYDYNPSLFKENVEKFVQSLGKVEYLDLFLSGLTSEDVTKTVYRETLNHAESLTSQELAPKLSDLAIKENTTEKPKSKINTICDSILAVLLDKYSQTYTQSIITAYVCKEPPDIDSALQLVSEIAHDDNKKLMSAVEHLCYLQDINVLYNYALGLYDLRLALIIARQSQKDPREYVPFITNLQKQRPLWRHFLLDTHLGRFARALGHLCEVKYDEEGQDIFPKVEEFVVQHSLYREALSIYKYEPVRQYSILKLYGQYLKSEREYLEAGIAYETLGEFSNALDCYVLGLNWREAVSVCGLARHYSTPPNLKTIAEQLAEGLMEARRYREASTLYIEYCHNLREGLRALCKGYGFAEAIRIVLLQNEDKYLEEIIDPAVVEGFSTISEFLSDCKSQLTAQLARLRELRLKKEEDPFAYFDGLGMGGDVDVPDNVSIAATSQASTTAGGSLFTRYTGKTGGTAQTGASRRTAKNRRREERKRARGKKGSIYEEEYLVSSIRRMIGRVNETRSDARAVVEALLRRTMREQALEIQKRYLELVCDLQNCVTEVCTISERDRMRYDDDGQTYLIPEEVIPVVEEFAKLAIIDYP